MTRAFLFALSFSLLAACGPSASSGEGGNDSTSTGSAGSTGTGGTGGADPCATVRDGHPCEITTACSYDSQVFQCAQVEHLEAACTDGAWVAPIAASCGPIAPTASCNPVGTWKVHAEWPDGGQLTQPGPVDFSLVYSLAASGAVLLSAGADSAKVSPDGCTLSVGWIIGEWPVPEVGGFESITERLDLTISGDSATGTLEKACFGECGGPDTVSATATRE